MHYMKKLCEEISKKLCKERDKKITVFNFWQMFMMLVVFKIEDSWDTLASLFKISTAYFQSITCKFLPFFHNQALIILWKNKRNNLQWTIWSSKILNLTIFQLPFMPRMSLFKCSIGWEKIFKNTKKYYSGKHQFYGYKTEFSVLPNGIAMNCSSYFPGSVRDTSVFRKNFSWHRLATKNGEDSETVRHTFSGSRSTNFQSWDILLGKYYFGPQFEINAIFPKRNVPIDFFQNLEKTATN